MTPPTSPPPELRARLAEALAGDAGVRVRRAWPVDLDDPAAGLALEVETSRGRRGALLTGDGLRVLHDDSRLPRLHTHLAAGHEVIGWRPGKRAVLRGEGGVYVKLTRPRATHRALAALAAVDTLLRDVPGAPDLPRAVGGSAPHGVLELAPAPGRPLSCTLAEDPRGEADAVAELLLALAHAPVDDAAGPGSHTAADEARVVTRWAAAALALAPLTDAERRVLQREAPRVAARLARTEPTAAPVLAHRDLHEGQVLRGERTVVLDWDTAARAHPGTDLANLLAHVGRLARLGELPADPVRAFRHRLLGRLAQEGHPAVTSADARRHTALLEHATRVRLVAVHAFRPRAATGP